MKAVGTCTTRKLMVTVVIRIRVWSRGVLPKRLLKQRLDEDPLDMPTVWSDRPCQSRVPG